MRQQVHRPMSKAAAIVFDVLDPIPYGFFVGALVFDAIYAKSGEVLWFKAAAWLIAIGLVFAVLPRLITLGQVGVLGRGGRRAPGAAAGFWLNLVAVVA